MALDFSGSGQYLSLAATPPVVPMTMAAWFRHDNLTLEHELINFGNTGTTLHHHRLIGRQTGEVWAESNANSTSVRSITSNTIAPGVWGHAAGVWASASSRIAYLDGVAATPETTSRTPTCNVTQIAARNNGGSIVSLMDGQIAEAAIWSTTLAPEEIAALARGVSPRSIRPASLWGYWPILGLDSPEPDWSGNGRHMALTGSPVLATHAPTQLWLPPRPGWIQTNPIYTQTKFRLYTDDGTGLGEAA